MESTVGFIGAGTMAEALARGLAGTGRTIYAADPSAERRTAFGPLANGGVFAENRAVVEKVAVLILAVKPQVMKAALAEIGPVVTPHQLVVSIAAGIGVDCIRRSIPRSPIVRVMPNTPCLVGKGMSVLFAPPEVSEQNRHAAEALFRSCGKTAWVAEEPILDTVTALSGSGPAYFFRFCECLTEAGRSLGLPPELAATLALQTFIGAAELLAATGETPEALRRKVTSPGGTTEAALRSFEERGFFAVVEAALGAAQRRAAELRAQTQEERR